MYSIRVSLFSNKLKYLLFAFILSVSAVLENLTISSCSFKHLYFRILTNPDFSLNFVHFMFLSIVIISIAFSFLEENSLVCRDI